MDARQRGIDVAVLDGGIGAWPQPLSTVPARSRPATFTPRPWPSHRFVDADAVAARGSATVVLDARPAERFRGDPNPIDPRFGHIPGARSRPSLRTCPTAGSAAQTSCAVGWRAGHRSDTPVIASCGSGVTRMPDLLAVRLAGIGDGRLYVGSWSDWGADPDRQVETGDDPR